jgi:hypothetical protein
MIENLIFSMFNRVLSYMNKETKNGCVCSLETNYYSYVYILDLFTRNTSNILKSNKNLFFDIQVHHHYYLT